MAEDKTLRVTGKGLLRVKPDLTQLLLTLSGVCPEYKEALAESAKRTEALKDLAVKHGFARTDLKTLQFNVDTKYESYKDHGAYKERFVGYEYKHRLKLDFPADNTRLGKILASLSRCEAKPRFSIGFSVQDEEAAKNALLAAAVKDAAAKAEILASAANCRLGGILSIDYTVATIEFESRPLRMLEMYDISEDDEHLDIDVEPDDIELTDTVTIVWGIDQYAKPGCAAGKAAAKNTKGE